MNTIASPYPLIGPTPTPFSCDTFGYAMRVIEAAGKLCLRASYHPNGGETAKANFPVTHTVFVAGTEDQIRELKRSLIAENAQ